MKTQRQILLVEDNPGDAELVQTILARKDRAAYHIHVRTRLAHALDFLSGHKADIVLLDLGLPDSQGLEAIGKIRERFPFLPIVVITGNGDEDLGVEALKSGAQDYMVKGLIPDHYLTQTIEYAIRRQESEYRLRQSEAKYKSIVENIGIGVALIDRDRGIIETNSIMNQWFPGLDIKTHVKCHQTIQCLCGGAEDYDRCPVGQTLKDGLSHRGISQKGKTTYRLLSSPLKDGNGRVDGAILLMEDISERVAVETRLRQAQKMESLGTLAGGVAHDFNNILTAIQGFASLARFEAGENEKLRDDLAEILMASQRATDLVKQILTFSRMGECEKQPIRMDLIVKEVLKLLRSILPSTIEIKNLVQSRPEKILADPTQVHQIMMNLCTNAAHAMEATGGILEVSLENFSLDDIRRSGVTLPQEQAHLKLMVRDTGTGIAPEHMESIFDPYFTTKRVGEGTGLGLSVVQGIVTDCGGEIHVASVPGKGSCFSLYFPVCTVKKETEADKPEMASPLGCETILLVDDEPSILKMGTRLFQRYGYKVKTCANAFDALDYVRAHPNDIDLIVSDMTMPRMTGLEFAEHLASLPIQVPVIIMTGYSRMLSPRKIQKAGICEVVSKPISAENLIVAVRRILDQRSGTP